MTIHDSTTTTRPTTPGRRAARPDAADERRRVERRLRTVLRINVATSLLSGTVMAIAPAWLDGMLDTGHPGRIRAIGIAFLPFAVLVARASTLPRHRLAAASLGIAILDEVWVIASVVTLVLGWYASGGAVLVAAAALLVGIFAVVEFHGWRALRV